MAQEFKPFPDISHDYDYEGKVNPSLPTAKDSQLFDSLEKLVMGNQTLLKAVEDHRISLPSRDFAIESTGVVAFQVVAEFVLAKNSEQRRKKRDQLLDFCQRDPLGYSNVLTNIQMQMGQPDNLSKGILDHLYQEIKPPEFFRGRWYFQAHVMPDPDHREDIKGKTRQQIEQVFVKGEKNTFFFEEFGGNMYRNDQVFQRGFNLYRSVRKAVIYTSLFLSDHVEPTRAVVEKGVENVYKRINLNLRGGDNDKLAYRWIVAELLDEFIDEGYDISIVHERGSEKHKADDLTTKQSAIESGLKNDNLSLDDFKRSYSSFIAKLDRDQSDRDRIIISQMEEFSRLVEQIKEKTNFFGMLGTLHQGLISRLPLRLRGVTAHAISEDTHIVVAEESKAIDQLTGKLQRGEPISESLWEEAWKEWISGN